MTFRYDFQVLTLLLQVYGTFYSGDPSPVRSRSVNRSLAFSSLDKIPSHHISVRRAYTMFTGHLSATSRGFSIHYPRNIASRSSITPSAITPRQMSIGSSIRRPYIRSAFLDLFILLIVNSFKL
jgi:hypothetical protein